MRLEKTLACAVLGLVTGLAAGLATGAPAALAADDDAAYAEVLSWNALDASAPIDYGPGRGLGRARPRFSAALATRAAPNVVPASTDAGSIGSYGPPIAWPVIPIHVALLPDGRVMSFGTDENGVRGAELYYDVWDPRLGTDTNAHALLPNTTGADIFCSYQSLMWTSGDLMTVGGDLRPERKPNNSASVTTVFDAPSNTIAAITPMITPRWYGTLAAMPDGSMVALGGRQFHAKTTTVGAPTPERFDPGIGWHALANATSDLAFFTRNMWFYPRAVVAPNGLLFIPGYGGEMFWLDPTADGTLTQVGKTSPATDALPVAMYAPGKLLSLRGVAAAAVFDLTGATPTVTPTSSLSQARLWANATVMADGKVLVNGGSSVSNQLVGIAYQNETWDPATGQWTLGAMAAKPRLYHSVALLLTDGTVLTGSGGSPGPVKNLNAEIYYPPYLFLHDGSGQPAPRPTLQASASVVTIGQPITASVGASDQISRLTLVKFGATTHSLDIDQRFIELGFTQTGQALAATLPASANTLVPGYYMLFAFNSAGTPSVASTLLVLPQSSQGRAVRARLATAQQAARNPPVAN